VAVLTEPLPNTIELIEDKTVLYTVFEQIDSVYKQIKKNEISPNTEYLFSNLEKQNTFEKSVQKIEIMNQMMQGGGAT
jgi:hypothetical protein